MCLTPLSRLFIFHTTSLDEANVYLESNANYKLVVQLSERDLPIQSKLLQRWWVKSIYVYMYVEVP